MPYNGEKKSGRGEFYCAAGWFKIYYVVTMKCEKIALSQQNLLIEISQGFFPNKKKKEVFLVRLEILPREML